MKPIHVYVAVYDLVDRPSVAMEGEDDRLVGSEQFDEACLAHPVRVELAREEAHQVNDVDYAHLELGGVLAQPPGRSHGLKSGDIPGTGENSCIARKSAPAKWGTQPPQPRDAVLDRTGYRPANLPNESGA